MSQQLVQKTQTSFANKESNEVYTNMGERNLTKGKIIHMPGEIEDSDYKNRTVFACVGAKPDLNKPIVQLISKTDQNGTASLDKKFYDGYENAFAEWKGLVQKFGSPKEAYRQLRTSPSVASIVNTQTIDETKSLNIMDGVLGLQERSFFTQMAVTRLAANQLIFTLDRYTEGTVQAKVPEMQPPDLIAHEETRVTKILYKNIGHISETEEARLMALHDTMGLRQEKTIKDMGRLLNSQIATELETAITIAGSDWQAKSGTPPDSANSPVFDLNKAMTIIEGNGFNTDYITAHNDVVTAIGENKFVTGRANIGIQAELNQHLISYPGLPSIIKDQAFTNTIAIVGNKEATFLGEGPTIIASYDEDVAGYRGWLIKQWMFPYVAEPAAIRGITGVYA